MWTWQLPSALPLVLLSGLVWSQAAQTKEQDRIGDGGGRNYN